MDAVSVIRGNGPLILSQPHSGTWMPKTVADNLTAAGRQLMDTDWHIPKLYDGLIDNPTIIKANFSRQVIDVNRDPQGSSLYPGQATTGLVPLTSFDGEPLWKTPPSSEQISSHRLGFHTCYHQALAHEIVRVKNAFGIALLYDCHSIRSPIPRLFEGRLPDLNIGTYSGASCAPEIANTITRLCQGQRSFSYVVNGRFRGGWITRHYGQPDDGVHAVQMELAQPSYLDNDATPPVYCPTAARPMRSLLQTLLQALQTIALSHHSLTRKPS